MPHGYDYGDMNERTTRCNTGWVMGLDSFYVCESHMTSIARAR